MSVKTGIAPPLPDGFGEVVALAGHLVEVAPDGVYADDQAAVSALLASYAGSPGQLAWAKRVKQAALDDQFDQHFDLAKFIRGGTVATVTAAQVGSFLATITNNYRSLRTSIAAASTVAAVQAINIAGGWPSNP